MMAMTGYWLAGLWKPEVTHDYLVTLPAVIAAIFLGKAVSGRLDGHLLLAASMLGSS